MTSKVFLSRYYDSSLTAEEERSLGERIKRGDWEARDALIAHGVELAVSIAYAYRSRTGGGLEDDLVSEAILGVIRAVDSWDCNAGRFLGYASYHVHRVICTFLASQRLPVSIPINIAYLAKKWSRADQQMTVRLGRRPEPDEIAEELGFSKLEFHHAMQANAAEEIRSLTVKGPNARVGEFQLQAPDPSARPPLVSMVDSEERRQFESALAKLGNQDRRILTMKFGLNGMRPLRPLEIARRFGYSVWTVYKKQDTAVARLRAAALA